jgi:hypothetical protein
MSKRTVLIQRFELTIQGYESMGVAARRRKTTNSEREKNCSFLLSAKKAIDSKWCNVESGRAIDEQVRLQLSDCARKLESVT